MVAYLDSSVLLRHILLGEEPIRHALEFPRVVSSELIEIECRRVLHRYRLAGELTDETLPVARELLDEVLAGIDLVELSRQIKQRAMEPFPVNVRTLDALHIATALMVAEDAGGMALFSHDEGMNRCARSLGLTTALKGTGRVAAIRLPRRAPALLPPIGSDSCRTAQPPVPPCGVSGLMRNITRPE